jgi:hypothetical protein
MVENKDIMNGTTKSVYNVKDRKMRKPILACPLTNHTEVKEAMCRDWASKDSRCDNCPIKLSYRAPLNVFLQPSYSGVKKGSS